MARPIVHRGNMNARPLCGATSGFISASGVMLTCPECERLSRPLNREEQIALFHSSYLRTLEAQSLTSASL